VPKGVSELTVFMCSSVGWLGRFWQAAELLAPSYYTLGPSLALGLLGPKGVSELTVFMGSSDGWLGRFWQPNCSLPPTILGPKGVSELTIFMGSSDGRLGWFPHPNCPYYPEDLISMAIFLCQGSFLPTPSSSFWMAL